MINYFSMFGLAISLIIFCVVSFTDLTKEQLHFLAMVGWATIVILNILAIVYGVHR